jgi:hypothetical protein
MKDLLYPTVSILRMSGIKRILSQQSSATTFEKSLIFVHAIDNFLHTYSIFYTCSQNPIAATILVWCLSANPDTSWYVVNSEQSFQRCMCLNPFCTSSSIICTCSKYTFSTVLASHLRANSRAALYVLKFQKILSVTYALQLSALLLVSYILAPCTPTPSCSPIICEQVPTHGGKYLILSNF